jgi:hypothetical protein
MNHPTLAPAVVEVPYTSLHPDTWCGLLFLIPSLLQCDTDSAVDFDSQPALLTIIRCGYVVRCRAGRCTSSAATILRKSEASGRPLRQIELCPSHAEVVIRREQRRGLTLSDWR